VVDADRFQLLLPSRRLVPIAILFVLGAAVLVDQLWMRVGCGVFAVLGAAVIVWQRRAHPEVLVDEQGYAVCEYGREKLRVAWSEVKRVRADRAEHAVYVDCGEPARNLLVPPRRGFGFRFARAAELYAKILDRVPAEKIEMVARLDARPPPSQKPNQDPNQKPA
jgi:hypothetical protein